MKRTYFNDIFILLTHQGRQFDGCRIGIVKSTGFGYSVLIMSLCQGSKMSCRLHCISWRFSMQQEWWSMAGTSFSLSAWTTGRESKSCLPHCYSMSSHSQNPLFHLPSLFNKGDVWQSDQTFFLASLNHCRTWMCRL